MKSSPTSASLNIAERRRLQRLAESAKTTPQKMLKHVLRDGFAYCEYVVREVNAGIASLDRGGRTYSTQRVVQHIQGLIEGRDRRSKKAA